MEGTPTPGVLSPTKEKSSKTVTVSKANMAMKPKSVPVSKAKMTIKPKYCHTFASKTGLSSKRTRAAAGGYIQWCTSQLWP
jgi:hypothetical protein